MIVAITGTTLFNNFARLQLRIIEHEKKHGPITQILTGDGPGCDELVRKYATEHNIALKMFDSCTKANMINDADHLLIFWDGTSKGTRAVLNQAIIQNISLFADFYEEKDQDAD